MIHMMGKILRSVVVVTTVLLFLTTVVGAVDFEECGDCHGDIYAVWSSSPHGSASCDICHTASPGGFDAHISAPFTSSPDVSLSAEVCGDCHSGVYDEWNEFGEADFDMESIASHSEPTDVAEPYVLDREASCTACKSTDGGILNIADAEPYALDEEGVHELEVVSEWAISCAACHDPHDTGPRIDDSILLCGNCHNTEGVVMDGNTPVVRHAQWELVSTSGYVDGTHPTSIGCVDCHMVQISTDEVVETGHTFDFDAELLSNPDSGNNCSLCHQSSLPSLIEEKQAPIESHISSLNSLEETAGNALESINGTDAYEEQRANYNNGQFYLTKIENDGSLGIHNLETATNDLVASEELFNKVIIAGAGSDDAGEPVPGFSAFISIALFAAVAFIVRKGR